MVYRLLLAVATEVWSLLVPMRLGHLVFVLQCLSKWRYAFVRKQSDEGDMELYSKLSHDITQVIEAPIVEKASIDEFYLILREWIGFMAVTSGQMNFHNQLQRNRIAAKFCAIC
jgi:hypothetical protein